MQNLGDLLKKYKRIFPPDVVVRDALADILTKRFLHDTFTRKDISVKGRVALVSCSSLYRSEILLNKKELLEELRERIAPHVIDDIR